MTARRRILEPADPEDFRSLLEFLKQNRGFDFTGYKRSSLQRRIKKRMDAVGLTSYGDYEDYLEVHPDEFGHLFDTILINVTGFFRDRPAWDFVAHDVVPQLIEATPKDQPIRVWSAACASGEEAYTTAIVLAEALGEQEFRRRVKIYATDVDEDALDTARRAVFAEQAMKAVPDEYREKYFEPNSKGHVFRADLRRSVIFGRNDLVQDAPITRVDLLVSRNALMYFTPETQARILSHFNFALRETGFLFLGKSEMLITHTDLFTPYNVKCRVFRTVPRPGAQDRMALIAPGLSLANGSTTDRNQSLLQAASDSSPVPQIAVDTAGFLMAANAAARAAFQMAPADLGRPLQDFELSYRPIELRSGLDEARKTRQPVQMGRAVWRGGSPEERTYDVEIQPLLAGGELIGSSVTFTDVSDFAKLDREHKAVQHQLETAYEELQSTVEELETTNEELQSTNEELETTNEELQSTNEELETTNEELQSANDELEAMNEEQRERSGDLDRLNLFLESILGQLRLAVVVVDNDQRIQLWNSSATELWGLRAAEVIGEHLLTLDIGLPLEELKPMVRETISGDGDGAVRQVVLDAVNRRGRKFECLVRALPLSDPAGTRYGAVLLMSEANSAEQ